jgi:hypothetical protein
MACKKGETYHIDRKLTLLLYLGCVVTPTLVLVTVTFNRNNNFNHAEFLMYKLKHKQHMLRKLSEDGQHLRPKHVGALINQYSCCASWC